MLREGGLNLQHFTGIGEVDLSVMLRAANDIYTGYGFGRRQLCSERHPLLCGTELDVYSQVRGRILVDRGGKTQRLLPLTGCIYRRIRKDDVGLVQHLAHRRRVEMKRNVGGVARRVA